ncbi:MAG: acylphosphatase [Anaerolineae bacterium]|nr:acylphosphatase [Anaerolineae bacterium]
MSDKNVNTAAHLIVHGRVQGVGFRYFTQKTALRLGLVGWVKNLGNGNVEIWAEGPKETLQVLIQEVYKGPISSIVESVDEEWYTPKEQFGTFGIHY